MKNRASMLYILASIFFTNLLVGQKIGYVNVANLLSELTATKEAESALLTRQAQFQAKLQQITLSFQEAYQVFQQKESRGEFSPAQKDREMGLLQVKQDEISRFEQDFVRQMEQMRAEIFNPINERLMAEINAVALENGYDFIFSSDFIVYVSPSADVAPLVKWKMENGYAPVADKQPVIAPVEMVPFEPAIDPVLMQAMLGHLRTPGVSVLPDGSIKVVFEDGAYNIYPPGGGIKMYQPDGTFIEGGLFAEVQGADPPKPLQSFLGAQQQEVWINGLNKWLEALAESSFYEISGMLENDPNGITHYSNLEKSKCANLYQKLDFRIKFLAKLRQAKSSIQN